MATVWELITESSTLLETNDFWDHLNNLGEGGPGGFVLAEHVDVEVDIMSCVDVEVENQAIDVELEADIDVEIDSQEIDVEVECYEHN